MNKKFLKKLARIIEFCFDLVALICAALMILGGFLFLHEARDTELALLSMIFGFLILLFQHLNNKVNVKERVIVIDKAFYNKIYNELKKEVEDENV
jgi:TRAP-type C4-dicarboxylate transport system permease small subunit